MEGNQNQEFIIMVIVIMGWKILIEKKMGIGIYEEGENKVGEYR